MPDDAVDAVVVGYGPVGAVAAALLGRAGLRTTVLEATSSVYHLPRAAHMDAEIMRVLDEIGVGDDVRPTCAPISGMHFINADGEALVRFDVPSGASFMFYQPELERALRAGVDRLPSVDVHLEHEVVGFEQHADHVEVTVRDLATGRSRVRGPGTCWAPTGPGAWCASSSASHARTCSSTSHGWWWTRC